MAVRKVPGVSMLLVGLVAAASAFAQEPTAGFVRASSRICDPTLAGRDYAECLRKAQESSERSLLDAMSAAAAAIDKSAGTVATQRARWKRSLEDAQSQWLRFRNIECQDVAPFEVSNRNRLFEERGACIVDKNVARIEDLRRRYPAPPAS